MLWDPLHKAESRLIIVETDDELLVVSGAEELVFAPIVTETTGTVSLLRAGASLGRGSGRGRRTCSCGGRRGPGRVGKPREQFVDESVLCQGRGIDSPPGESVGEGGEAPKGSVGYLDKRITSSGWKVLTVTDPKEKVHASEHSPAMLAASRGGRGATHMGILMLKQRRQRFHAGRQGRIVRLHFRAQPRDDGHRGVKRVLVHSPSVVPYKR